MGKGKEQRQSQLQGWTKGHNSEKESCKEKIKIDSKPVYVGEMKQAQENLEEAAVCA